ncbi:lasso peptide biosynthesis B2 protein [Actinomadura sp. 7K507]|uniref:lasso peptide biosynthesis B2 protein n=1 Tax=Actinomadura sp. 7K507 TaxID=2530365 RepID=UPI002442E02E|nr:lasso peptide biosynthesis B2 protein [Actinomadura sp. 7K507]
MLLLLLRHPQGVTGSTAVEPHTGRHDRRRKGSHRQIMSRLPLRPRPTGENSLAAFILLALRRRSVDWCVGCRFMPAESHAWIQIEGQPVGEPDPPDRPFRVTVQI